MPSSGAVPPIALATALHACEALAGETVPELMGMASGDAEKANELLNAPAMALYKLKVAILEKRAAAPQLRRRATTDRFGAASAAQELQADAGTPATMPARAPDRPTHSRSPAALQLTLILPCCVSCDGTLPTHPPHSVRAPCHAARHAAHERHRHCIAAAQPPDHRHAPAPHAVTTTAHAAAHKPSFPTDMWQVQRQ